MILPIHKSTKQITELIKAGYGQGDGASYKPYINILRTSSKGRVTRVKGHTTKRTHSFLSDTETRFFYLLEFNPFVIDIREHFPIYDDIERIIPSLDSSLRECLQNQKTGEPIVLTTSFLITIQNENKDIYHLARSIKDYRLLKNNKVIERYEIMRRYWESKDIDYGIVTNKEIPINLVKNIEYLHSAYSLEEYGFNENDQTVMIQFLTHLISSNPSKSWRKIVEMFDFEMRVEAGTGLLFLKHILIRRKVIMNLNKPINLECNCSEITFDCKEVNSNVFSKYIDSV
jgi:TnsA endonuclease C terminal/TnsA endonuclease N terminal